MIQLRNISKSYEGRRVLQAIDLEIPRGQTRALVGASGCGKSTLLRVIMGLIPPDAGDVWIDGERLTQEDARRLRHSMGYVIQDGGLFPHLTAADNVTLLARHLGWELQRSRKRLDELAALVEFPTDGLRRFPAQLSGGQRQRVGLMRALILDPPVLLMDEPLGALDPIIRSSLQEDLKTVFARLRKTVVLVTHDMGEAAYLADEISVMREGRVLQTGTAEALVRSPADEYVTRFISAQRQNWLPQETP